MIPRQIGPRPRALDDRRPNKHDEDPLGERYAVEVWRTTLGASKADSVSELTERMTLVGHSGPSGGFTVSPGPLDPARVPPETSGQDSPPHLRNGNDIGELVGQDEIAKANMGSNPPEGIDLMEAEDWTLDGDCLVMEADDEDDTNVDATYEVPHDKARSGFGECGTTPYDSVDRIVGGKVARVNAYPWTVGLSQRAGRPPFCGASLISERVL